MPELPEVETVRRQLEPVIVDQTIRQIKVLRPKSWQGNIAQVQGASIASVRRKAKILIIDLVSTEPSHLLIHLKMTGQLIYEADSTRIVGGHPNNSWTNSLPDKHTRVILELSRGNLYFNDMRVFGWVKHHQPAELIQMLEKMPPDIIDPNCTLEYFYQILQRSGRAVKLVILDSHKLGGVGNIYANDGLFAAGIDPRRSANSLNRVEAETLLKNLKQVVQLGIKLGGATAADGKFVNTQGYGGKYQEHFLVYEREGEPCPNCINPISKIKLAGRGTYFCSQCQI